MNVLISRLSSLGDTVCCLPVATAMKKSFPDCHISWVVDPRFAAIVDRCPSVDLVIRHKPKIGEKMQFDRTFDIAMDLQGLLKSAWPIFWAKAGRKVGYHWQREGSWLFSSRVLPDPSSLHVVDQYVDVARSVGATVDRAEFGLTPSSEDVLNVRKKLKVAGVGGRFVVINPTAAWVTKRWPITHFAKLIDGLAEAGLPSVLIGGSAQADLTSCASVIEHCKSKPADLAGKTSVGELIALIRLGSAHVGGDTGSSHIAAALDVKAIGLYSITNPQRSCPYGQIERCHYNPKALEEISVEAVLESVLQAVGAEG